MSKIQVDAIEQQTACGTTLTAGGGAGKTVVVDATTVTLGRCGGTVALALGATQSGFGRTGTVDWQTGSIKTGTFTAVNGEGYFVDTSGGVSTANLPAGSAGAIVSFADYTRTFQTNNLTITPNGSEKIGGVASNFVAQTEGQSITLVYVDATEGWINTAESTGQSGLLPAFVTATGGTITTVCTDYKVHTFTGPGTFTVCSAGNALGSSTVDYMVVAGGAGGNRTGAASYSANGAGGAGGFRESSGTASGCYSASPLGACVSALPVSITGYPITVGAGGAGGTSGGAGGGGNGGTGNLSTFSTITSAGGGFGGGYDGSAQSGGSGGGGGASGGPAGGIGNTPPVSPSQGNNGGTVVNDGSGGGGGAGAAGSGGSSTTGFAGGAGVTTSISATPTAYAGGGGGGGYTNPGGAGGTGGGGAGGGQTGPGATSTAGTAGTTNTGGGGGAGGGTQSQPSSGVGGSGGSGIVIIRYKFQ